MDNVLVLTSLFNECLSYPKPSFFRLVCATNTPNIYGAQGPRQALGDLESLFGAAGREMSW